LQFFGSGSLLISTIACKSSSEETARPQLGQLASFLNVAFFMSEQLPLLFFKINYKQQWVFSNNI